MPEELQHPFRHSFICFLNDTNSLALIKNASRLSMETWSYCSSFQKSIASLKTARSLALPRACRYPSTLKLAQKAGGHIQTSKGHFLQKTEHLCQLMPTTRLGWPQSPTPPSL